MKRKLLPATLLLLLASSSLLTAQQTQTKRLNSHERAFMERIGERTFPILLPEEAVKTMPRIKSLLSKGDIGANSKGLALTRAAAVGDSELMQLLLSAGANVNFKGPEGLTVLMNAAAGGIFIQCGNDPLIESYPGNTKIIQMLLDACVRLDDQDDTGNTALMLAAASGRHASVALLLKAGANVRLKNKYGETALKQARRNPAIIDMLTCAGAID